MIKVTGAYIKKVNLVQEMLEKMATFEFLYALLDFVNSFQIILHAISSEVPICRLGHKWSSNSSGSSVSMLYPSEYSLCPPL